LKRAAPPSTEQNEPKKKKARSGLVGKPDSARLTTNGVYDRVGEHKTDWSFPQGNAQTICRDYAAFVAEQSVEEGDESEDESEDERQKSRHQMRVFSQLTGYMLDNETGLGYLSTYTRTFFVKLMDGGDRLLLSECFGCLNPNLLWAFAYFLSLEPVTVEALTKDQRRLTDDIEFNSVKEGKAEKTGKNEKRESAEGNEDSSSPAKEEKPQGAHRLPRRAAFVDGPHSWS
jgi:hypothetical protein